jgi:hypothetical protein
MPGRVPGQARVPTMRWGSGGPGLPTVIGRPCGVHEPMMQKQKRQVKVVEVTFVAEIDCRKAELTYSSQHQ